jgi:hypothetical protein
VRFTTWTLRYHEMEWLRIDALERHWARADIDAQLVDEGTFRIETKNVAAFTIALPAAPAPLDKTHPPRVLIDEQDLVGPPVADYWTAHFQKIGGKWNVVPSPPRLGLRKRHGLTGPIDDAFLDRLSSSGRPDVRLTRGREMGRGRDGARDRTMADGLPRRGARRGRCRVDGRDHRQLTSCAVGRPEQQFSPRARDAKAADPVDSRGSRGRA